MAKQIKQIRWFGDGDKRNYPSTVNVQDLLDKNYFEQFSPILQLSIHTLPGVKVYFNDQTDNPIYVGHSGVYQLDLQDTSAVLWGMHFDSEDLDDIEDTNVGLIIDLMYSNVAEDDSEAETETIITSTGGSASVSVSTHIKNIHKNIWYGVNDKIAPRVMERDSQLEKLKADFALMLQKLKEKYQNTLNQMSSMDASSFPDAMANCTACYEKCLKEIIDYYTEAIDTLEKQQQNDFEGHQLAQSFSERNPDKVVSQKALYDLIARINKAFNDLYVDSRYVAGETPEITLEHVLEGQPNLEKLLGEEGE